MDQSERRDFTRSKLETCLPRRLYSHHARGRGLQALDRLLRLEASFSRSSATSAPGDGSIPYRSALHTWSQSPSWSRRPGSEPPAPSHLSKCGCVRMPVPQLTAVVSSSIGFSAFCTMRPPLGCSRLVIRSLVYSSRQHGGAFHRPPNTAAAKQMPNSRLSGRARCTALQLPSVAARRSPKKVGPHCKVVRRY